MYRLKGVVVHIGSADGGHYYAITYDGEQWFEFNDDKVKEFNVENLESEAFGGFYERMNKSGVKEKAIRRNNAYLLFYEKVNMNEGCDVYDHIVDVESYNNYSGIVKHIVIEIDRKFIRQNMESVLYTNEYNLFMLNFILNALGINRWAFTSYTNIQRDIKNQKLTHIYHRPVNSSNNNITDTLSLFKVLILYYFNVLIRSQNTTYCPSTMDLLLYMMSTNTTCAEYLLEEFSNEDTIREYLYICPLFEVCKNTVCLLYKSLQLLHTASAPHSLLSRQNIKTFIDSTFTFFISVYPSMQNISPLIYLIYRMSLISPEIKGYLIKAFKLPSFINSLRNGENMEQYLESIQIKYQLTPHNILNPPQHNHRQSQTFQRNGDTLCRHYLLLLSCSITEHTKCAAELKQLSNKQLNEKHLIKMLLQCIKHINDRTTLQAFARLMNTLITSNMVFDTLFDRMFAYILGDVNDKMHIWFYSLKLMRAYLERNDEHKQRRIKSCFALFIENVNAMRKHIDNVDIQVYVMCCDFILDVYLYANDVYVRAKENKTIRKIIQEGICVLQGNEMSVQRKIRYEMFVAGVLEEHNIYEDTDRDLRDYEFKEGMKVEYNGNEYDVIARANEKVLVGRGGKEEMWVSTDSNGLLLLREPKTTTGK